MTEQQKKDLLHVCELAERITAETAVQVRVEFSPGTLHEVVVMWYRRTDKPDANGNRIVNGNSTRYCLEYLIPYLETILQTAPRKPAPKEKSR